MLRDVFSNKYIYCFFFQTTFKKGKMAYIGDIFFSTYIKKESLEEKM